MSTRPTALGSLPGRKPSTSCTIACTIERLPNWAIGMATSESRKSRRAGGPAHDCFAGAGPSDRPPSPLAQCPTVPIVAPTAWPVTPGDPGIVGCVQPTALSDPATVETVVRVGRPEGCHRSARSRCWRVPYGCLSRNLMSIRRGSQRRLGRPSAVIAGAMVTDSTLLPMSRRQAADRFAGSRSLSISSGPTMLLSLRSPSRARTACASSSALVSFARSPGSRAGPTIRAR